MARTRRLDRVFDMRRHRRHFTGLACLCLVMGLAHGLLLCVGCDGHASLHSGLHTHDHVGSHGEAARQSEDCHEDGHSHCSRCVDIPLPMVVVDGQVGADPVDPLACLGDAGGDVAALRTQLWGLHREFAIDSPSYFTPLSSIILVV